MAREFNAATQRGETLGLSDDEMAFYDALADNEAALQEMSEPALRAIALELTQNLRNSVSVDWAVRENVRARIRLLIRRIPRKHRYPTHEEQTAVGVVLQQAEVLSAQWAL
jgi:type I restriction enzyme R subunit